MGDFATSEVLITPYRIESWDRGWSDKAEQAWGSQHGTYIFSRYRVQD